MAAEPENENVIIVETQKRARKGTDILTAFNAPNDYSNPETFQRFTSEVENEVFPNTSVINGNAPIGWICEISQSDFRWGGAKLMSRAE